MAVLVKILTQLWLLFFILTIGVVGFSFLVPLYFPIYALSFVIPRLRGVHDKVMVVGIRFLMFIQPWFNAKVDLVVPETMTGPGVLLISNHRSHLDVFILLSRVRGIRILARRTLYRIPFLGMMMRASRQIGVERGRLDAWVRAMDEVKTRLGEGERVHVFPEMTRCPSGFQGLQAFTAGPFLAALQADAMVLPVVFKNTDGVWPKGWAGLNFRAPVEARSLGAFRARDFNSVDALKSEVQKRIEQALV